MLLDLPTICRRYGIANAGALHIGAHKAEERDAYAQCGFSSILWIEANPTLAAALQDKIAREPRSFVSERILNHAIFNEDGKDLEFHITNNLQSSSLLDLGLHAEHYPDVHVTETIKITTRRIDRLLQRNPELATNLTFANLDIQGVELQALQGFGVYLSQFRWIYTEVNTASVYSANALLWSIDRYLLRFGFVRREISLTDANWGDALYVRADALPSWRRWSLWMASYVAEAFGRSRFVAVRAGRRVKTFIRASVPSSN